MSPLRSELTASTSTPKKPRRRRRPGWVPNHHGAWAMLAVPYLVGTFGFRTTASTATATADPHPGLVLLLLGLTWFAGYFAFFATGLWFTSHFKAKYLPPVRAYALVTVLLGLTLLLLRPVLAWWALPYAPLLAASLWCSYTRRDRSLFNDSLTVLAACLMLPVAASIFDASAHLVWPAAAIVFAYFFGTVLYVKTMIRERNSRTYLRASIGYHCALVALPAVFYGLVSQWRASVGVTGLALFTAFFAGLAVRAVLVPRTHATPKQVGFGEIGASVVLLVLLLA